MALPGRSPKIRFYLYDNVARRFVEIYDGFLCGRIEGELQFPEDNVVSRKQCQFHISGTDVYVEDLNSTNKTKVNTVPLRPGHKRRLRLNDVIEFGAQRLVLSHQDRFSPANIQDRIRTGKLYKAARTDGGRLTSEVSQVFTQKTMVLLDKATFRKLRLEETFTRPRRPRTRAQALQGVPAGKGSRPQRNLSTWALAALLVAAWGGIVASLRLAGALEPGLPHEPAGILAGSALAMALGGAAALALYIAIFRRVFRRAAARSIVVLALTAGAAGGAWMLSQQTGLLSRAFQNLAVARCVRAWDAELCRRITDLEREEWIQLPGTLRDSIDAKLHR